MMMHTVVVLNKLQHTKDVFPLEVFKVTSRSIMTFWSLIGLQEANQVSENNHYVISIQIFSVKARFKGCYKKRETNWRYQLCYS